MKKTLLMTMDFAPMQGGVANYWANLSSFLPNDNLVVLAEEYENSLDFDIKQKYLIYRKSLISREKWGWPKWLPFLISAIKIVKREKIKQLLVAQVLPGGTVAYLIKKLYNVPYILSFHGLDLALAQQSKRKKYLLKKIIKNASQIIVNSNFTKQKLMSLNCFDEEKIDIIYPCPNICHSEVEAKKVEQFKQERGLVGKKILLTVSRLVQRKGHDKVLEAMPKIIKENPQVVYVIAGLGSYQAELEKIIMNLQLHDHVKIFNDIMNDDLPVCYQSSDIFIMPSRILANGDVEGFGIVYLEANLYKKPVIAGNCGGAVEAVENNLSGILIDSSDSNKIARAVLTLLADEEKCKQLGEYGHSRVCRKFTWEKQSQKLINILS